MSDNQSTMSKVWGKLRRWPGIVVGVMLAPVIAFLVNTYGPNVVERIDRQPPFRYVIGDDVDIYADGWTLALTKHLPEESPDKGSTCLDIRNWVLSRGGVDAGTSHLQLALEGRSESPVLIRGMQARILDRSRPINETLVTCPSAGAEDVIAVGFDLDEPAPVARIVEGDGALGDPYFSGSAVTLAQNEALLFSISASSQKCYCEWVLELDTVIEGEGDTFTIKSAGQPFKTTAYAKRYEATYDWAWYEQRPSFVTRNLP